MTVPLLGRPIDPNLLSRTQIAAELDSIREAMDGLAADIGHIRSLLNGPIAKAKATNKPAHDEPAPAG